MAATVSVTVFAWLMTGGEFTFVYPDARGAFYDFQALSFLLGRLDVPEWALEVESFVVAGKYYGYFGVTPALLRLPFVLSEHWEFGQMTRSFMLIEYFACLFGAYMLLCHITRLVRGVDSRPSIWAVLLLISATGLGSSLLFLASHAIVYHEAILCGIAFALWSDYFSLRYLGAPGAQWWSAALICGILSLHARAPSGLFSLGLLGCAAFAHLVANRHVFKRSLGPIAVGALAVISFLSLPGVAFLKFGTTDATPLRYHAQFTPPRLARIDGKAFHFANVRRNCDALLLRPAFEVRRRFPFFLFDLSKGDYPEAIMDLEEAIVGVAYAMAGLVLLALAGVSSAMAVPCLRRPLLLTLIASSPLLACMLMSVWSSHRYTADLIPSLVIVAVFGLVFLDTLSRLRRAALMSIGTVATLCSFALTLGLVFHAQIAAGWSIPEDVRANFSRQKIRVNGWLVGN